MSRPVLSAGLGSKLGRFRDMLQHDGNSFALKDGLKKQWPGRVTKISPAAVELHVTMSAFDDNPIQITLAPDKEAERALGPMAEDLRDCLLLEDRGYDTQRAASCAKHVLDDILRCLLGNVPELARAVGRACVFLGENSRRAHPVRDRRRGRLAAGLFPLVTR